jgi:hypothetical protein
MAGAQRNFAQTGNIQPVNAPRIIAIFGGAAPPMMCVDTTVFAKIMLGSFCVPLIEPKIGLALGQVKFVTIRSQHNSPFAAA